jgi:hypothetical protein
VKVDGLFANGMDVQRYVGEPGINLSMSWMTLFSRDFSVRFSYPHLYLPHLSLSDIHLKYIIIQTLEHQSSNATFNGSAYVASAGDAKPSFSQFDIRTRTGSVLEFVAPCSWVLYWVRGNGHVCMFV